MPIIAVIWLIMECKSENPYSNNIMPIINNIHPIESILISLFSIHSSSTFKSIINVEIIIIGIAK